MVTYNLEERTLAFSKDVILFCKKVPKNSVNIPLISQLVRSSTSIGANYRETNDNLSKKDSLLRLKIARKEAKETSYWLEILLESEPKLNSDLQGLIRECIEIRNILSSIIRKFE